MLIHECKPEFQFKKSSKNVKFGQCLYLNNIIHQIYCFNTLTNVLKRATLIRDVNKTYMIEIPYDTNRQIFIRKYYRKHY